MVDDSVTVVGGRIERVQLERTRAGVDDVVVRPGRNEHGVSRADLGCDTIKDGFPAPFFDAEELVKVVHFHTDLFSWPQRHDDELATLGRVEHLSKVLVLDCNALNVLHKSFHNADHPEIPLFLRQVLCVRCAPLTG